MNYLDKDTIRQLLNLGQGFIDERIAARQLEVIRKGFNYLSQPNNNMLYIGDEVGLGKTYIALGIASLMRHFDDEPERYQDLIIVPKENLQKKWSREIQRFIRHNYLLEDNRVKSVLGKPVAQIVVHHKLAAFSSDVPAYQLYRNGTFSFGVSVEMREKLNDLQERLTTPETKSLLEIAWAKGYYKIEKRTLLKRLFGYLLNACMPPVEMLIVDESHNFKHGVADARYGKVSDRNQVVSRYMGIWQPEDDDTALARDFPQLRAMVKPVVRKTILLSATPKTHNLLEMQRQLDCFLPQHILQNINSEEQAKEMLHTFFIRGNLNYEVDGELYSRNRCRYEHRSGNVTRQKDAIPLTIQNDDQAAFLALLQYKTIKHLNTRHNASFELGMLAGFETFTHDMNVRVTKVNSGKQALEITLAADSEEIVVEYEETRTGADRSQDLDVIVPILESYRQTFNMEPPHPKQDALVEAVGEMMLRGEKSLVFVRRIGSAREIERRLSEYFEARITAELKTKWEHKAESKLLKSWIEAYDNRQIFKKSGEMFTSIAARLKTQKVSFSLDFTPGEDQLETIKKGLHYILHNAAPDDEKTIWLSQLGEHLTRIRYSRELMELSYTLLLKHWRNWERTFEEDELLDEGTDEPALYFYHSAERTGIKAFKARLQKSDWLEINYYLIHESIPLGAFDASRFTAETIGSKDKENLRDVQRLFLQSVTSTGGKDTNAQENSIAKLKEQTLLTTLLLQYCREEIIEFVIKRPSGSALYKDFTRLAAILQGVLRKGSGFLPLAVAMNSEPGETLFLEMLSDNKSIFHLVLIEVKTIIRDFNLICSVNFSEEDDDGYEQKILRKLNNQAPTIGITGQVKRDRSIVAAQFRMPGFPYVLVTTDIFREGEDLHTYCQNIYHYGIAWNCSDMEQRTGRIDRINSLAYRRLTKTQLIVFDHKVHVFYPFITGTLEVNQIACLYESLNSFVETFNDFTLPLTERPIASTSTAIEILPPVIDQQLTSRYEHMHFSDETQFAVPRKVQRLIGCRSDELKTWMRTLCSLLTERWAVFYLQPAISSDGFSIRGVARLDERNERRGPFYLEVVNDEHPGQFKLKVSSHICSVSSRVHSKIMDQKGLYNVQTSDRFYLFTNERPLTQSALPSLAIAIEKIVRYADEIEERVTKGDEMPW